VKSAGARRTLSGESLSQVIKDYRRPKENHEHADQDIPDLSTYRQGPQHGARQISHQTRVFCQHVIRASSLPRCFVGAGVVNAAQDCDVPPSVEENRVEILSGVKKLKPAHTRQAVPREPSLTASLDSCPGITPVIISHHTHSRFVLPDRGWLLSTATFWAGKKYLGGKKLRPGGIYL
jgi:hypothetical protein